MKMHSQRPLKYYIEVADIHAQRLQKSLNKIREFKLITELDFKKLKDEQIEVIDSAIVRFTKLQDVIGAQIFPRIIEMLQEDAASFIDKLNKLEKLNYLSKSDWWIELRELRNNFTHEYPNDHIIIAKNFNDLMIQAPKLVHYWNELALKIEQLPQ